MSPFNTSHTRVVLVVLAGLGITCTNAITLTNTGRVRLVVDDILVNSTVGLQGAQCTKGGSYFNLTAMNATLLPTDQLICSFTAVPDQAAFEAGNIAFAVKAVGVAAYGTNPSIAGVLGGVVSIPDCQQHQPSADKQRKQQWLAHNPT